MKNKQKQQQATKKQNNKRRKQITKQNKQDSFYIRTRYTIIRQKTIKQ